MFHKYFEDYGYDSCSSRGVCSISPRMASISEIILLYIKEFANYLNKLQKLGCEDKKAKNLIINTLSAFVSNPEIPDDVFAKVICTYAKELENLKNKYTQECTNQNIIPEYTNSDIETGNDCDVIASIRLGEQKFLSKPSLAHYIQELIFFTAKSLTIYLIELNSMEKDSSSAFKVILNLLDSLNSNEISEEKLKSLLRNAAKEEYNLIKEISELKEKLYGTQQETEVNLSTNSGKAILVDGSNLRELEEILSGLKNTDIDVYTHGELISAHAYPKFKTYNNLKGHFGQGAGKSILDFSTFPGAVFIGRHSIDNIDNLYRGLLFTTDIIVPKGVIRIENSDYTNLYKAALNSKGFKKGKKLEAKKLNYNKERLKEKFSGINFDKYEGICLITQGNEYYTDRNYFEKFLKLIPDDIFVVNFSTPYKGDNIINICAGYNLNSIFEIVSILKENVNFEEKPIIAFVPRCDKHITNLIINLLQQGIKKIFMGKCAAKNINPTVVDEFCKLFDISKYDNVKEDYKTFIDAMTI